MWCSSAFSNGGLFRSFCISCLTFLHFFHKRSFCIFCISVWPQASFLHFLLSLYDHKRPFCFFLYLSLTPSVLSAVSAFLFDHKRPFFFFVSLFDHNRPFFSICISVWPQASFLFYLHLCLTTSVLSVLSVSLFDYQRPFCSFCISVWLPAPFLFFLHLSLTTSVLFVLSASQFDYQRPFCSLCISVWLPASFLFYLHLYLTTSVLSTFFHNFCLFKSVLSALSASLFDTSVLSVLSASLYSSGLGILSCFFLHLFACWHWLCTVCLYGSRTSLLGVHDMLKVSLHKLSCPGKRTNKEELRASFWIVWT